MIQNLPSGHTPSCSARHHCSKGCHGTAGCYDPPPELAARWQAEASFDARFWRWFIRLHIALGLGFVGFVVLGFASMAIFGPLDVPCDDGWSECPVEGHPGGYVAVVGAVTGFVLPYVVWHRGASVSDAGSRSDKPSLPWHHRRSG